MPRNRVCEALGAKLHDVIMDGAHPPPDGKTSRFHVYITLPVHSDGMLDNPSTMTQVHFTMQSLVFGAQSLINRIRRAILARQLRIRNARLRQKAAHGGVEQDLWECGRSAAGGVG